MDACGTRLGGDEFREFEGGVYINCQRHCSRQAGRQAGRTGQDRASRWRAGFSLSPHFLPPAESVAPLPTLRTNVRAVDQGGNLAEVNKGVTVVWFVIQARAGG